MAFVPTPGAAQARIRYTLENSQIENTVGLINASFTQQDTLQAAALQLRDLWSTVVMPLLSTALVLREVTVVDLATQFGFSGTAVAAPPVPGGIGGEWLPANVALCLTMRTARRGRGFRGRMYLPGLPESATVGSIINSDYATELRDAVQDVFTSMAFNGYTPVIVSRFLNNQPRAAGVTTPIASVVLRDLVVDSQRRRLPTRGS